MFMPFFQHRDQMSCESGCLLWGTHVVIPKKLQEKIMEELHWDHPGVCSMKGIARSYVCWPKLDANIEVRVKACVACQKVRATPKCLYTHGVGHGIRFKEFHVDFFENKDNFLILIDSYSKWIEVKKMGNTTVTQTIDELKTHVCSAWVTRTVSVRQWATVYVGGVQGIHILRMASSTV